MEYKHIKEGKFYICEGGTFWSVLVYFFCRQLNQNSKPKKF